MRRPTIKNSVFSCAFLALTILVLTACRPSTSPQETVVQARQPGTRGGRLVVADRGTPSTFNFLHAGDSVSSSIASFLMTSHLVELDHDTQQFVPGLAESWQASNEGKTITVKLREGLKFSDGAPLTTDDVLFTLTVATDEKSGSLFRENYFVGGKPMQATKLDDWTIKFDLPRAAASIESLFSIFGVLPRHKLAAIYAKGEFNKAWGINTTPAELAVTGAFTVKEFVSGQRTILVRNPHYWKKDKAGIQLPYLDELVIEAIPDANTALLKFQQGEVDLMDNIAPASYASLKQQTPAGISVRDYGASMLTDFLWFNLNDGKDATGKPLVDAAKRPIFSEVKFRQAIAHALDRPTMIQNVLRGLGAPLTGIISPSNKRWASNDLAKYDFDLQQAKDLLKEAGFQLRDNALVDKAGQPVEFTLIVDESVAVRKTMATIIQEDLAKLGIKVNIAPLEKNAFNEMIQKKFSYEAAIHGYAATDTDPSTPLMGLKTGGAQRYWFMNEKQAQAEWEKNFDRLADEQDTTTDAALRKQKLEEAQKIFVAQLPMIPLVVRNFASGAKSNLGNYRPSVILPRSLWNAEELFWKK